MKINMNNPKLTEEESKNLQQMIANIEAGEMSQVEDLFSNCNNPYQFAKTHSNYVKDWEKTKKKLEDNLKNNILPPNTSLAFSEALIEESDKIINQKLRMVQMLFMAKFNESIFNYLGSDGKTKFLGIF